MAIPAYPTRDTGTAEFIDVTTAAAFVPEVWSTIASVQTEQNLLMATRVDRRFEVEVRRFGDTIHVPTRTHMTADTKTANTAISFQTLTEVHTDISIATHEYVAFGVERIVDAQSNLDMAKFYSPEVGYALALAVDDVLAGLIDDAVSGQTVGTLAADTSDSEYRRARQFLRDANVPPRTEDWSIFISPAAESGLLGLDRATSADYAAIHGDGGNEALQQAYMGTYYRIPVYVSTNVEGSNAAGHDNGMFHREFCALVMQEKPEYWNKDDIYYFSTLIAARQLYGTKMMKDDHVVWVKGA